MKINYKELMTALAAIAGVIIVHSELLVNLPEAVKDGLTLAAFAVIALSKQIVESHEN